MKRFGAAMVLMGGLSMALLFGCNEAYPANNTAMPADNSAKNAGDNKDGAVTSGDQSNTQSDLNITQEIRKAVVGDKALSTNAHNVKIVTANAVVTLRGPVKNAAEKASVGAKAEQVSGVTRVDNQIEIASD
jgi:osmotically-inducible protein OsmY